MDAAYYSVISVWLLTQEEAASRSQKGEESFLRPSISVAFSVVCSFMEAAEELKDSKFPAAALSPLSPAPQCSSL